MDSGLRRLSRWLVVAGLGQILFGIGVLIWPGISLAALTLLFGAFTLTYGLFGIGAGLNLLAHKRTDWVPFLIAGLGGVVVGVVTFLHPLITALALTYLIAAWAAITGVSMIIAAIDMWSDVHGMAWVALSGILSIAFGVLVAVQPEAGVLAIIWLIGAYALAGGVTHVVAAWQVNRFRGDVARAMPTPQISRP